MTRSNGDPSAPAEQTPGGLPQEPVERRPAVPGTVRPEDYPAEEREDGDVTRRR